MADTACDRLTGLAAELRQTIAEFTPREALKNLRAVSKCWDEVATPILFSEFTYRLHTPPAEWSARVNFGKGGLVKKLNLTAIGFEPWNQVEHEDRVTPGARKDEPEHDNEYLRKAYAAYHSIRKDHLELFRKQECLKNLASLLQSMTNLVEVKLSGDCWAMHKFYPYSKGYNYCKLLGCNPGLPVDEFKNDECLN
ncbi:MAG: hypothetical protein Q9192_008613, partial [Flavoplaca navasiana]